MAEYQSQSLRQKPWWCEQELFWLLLVVIVAQFLRLDALTLRGEEPRRARIGWEMVQSGDWIVPQEQGEPAFHRPPLQNWLIGICSWIRGDCTAWEARFPSFLATALMTLLLYGYCRTFLDRVGAFAAALAFPTMAEILQQGGLAETEAMFTFFVSGSLLVWHWGYSRGWPESRMWMGGYAMAALGTLAKGPQAPVYFGASVFFFLVLTGQRTKLFTRAHLLGLFVFAVLFGAWAFPYTWRMGFPAFLDIFGHEAGARFDRQDVGKLLRHMVIFPLETWACMLPWSVLLLFYFRPSFWKYLGTARTNIVFLVTCIAVTFPSCWLVTEAKTRYYLIMYPIFCPLIGLVFQRFVEAPAGFPFHRYWRWFLTGCGLVLIGVPVLALTGEFLEKETGYALSQPGISVVGYSLAMGCLLVLLFRQTGEATAERVRLGLLLVAMCISLTFSFWFINLLMNRSVPTRRDILEAKSEIAGEKHNSFGQVFPLFAFHYDDPIPVLPWPKESQTVPRNLTYFCFNEWQKKSIPFAWEKVAVVNCDRTMRNRPVLKVIIGRVKTPY